MIKVALNGFGNIGRNIFEAAHRFDHLKREIQFVAINDAKFGDGLRAPQNVHCMNVPLVREHPWNYFEPDVVIDATGTASKYANAMIHLDAGAHRVLVTSSMDRADATLVPGVNLDTFDPEAHRIISGSSCTAVTLSPVLKALDLAFGINSANVLVLHGFDPTDPLSSIDHSRVDVSILSEIAADVAQNGTTRRSLPYGTNLAKNLEVLFPALAGKITASGSYVAVDRVLALEAKIDLHRQASVSDVNDMIREITRGGLKGVIDYKQGKFEPSKYIPENPRSSVFWADATSISRDGKTLQIWVGGDYIFGYSMRILDLVMHMIAGQNI